MNKISIDSMRFNLHTFIFLAKLHLIILILIFLFNIRKKITKVGLCVIGKLENLYDKEYVNYYKNLGYNHIFIYDNNEENDEYFETVLNEDINNGFVSIINYRGFRGPRNGPQFDAYYDCYEKNNKHFDWLSFFDFDEFLELIPNNLKINEFLENERFKKCECVKINWLLYSDNNLINYENLPIQSRFISPILNSSYNIHVKSTVKGKLKINYWKDAENPHTSIHKFRSCSSSGKLIAYNSPFNSPPDYKNAILRHYKTKTIDEYLVKLKRGRADKLLNFTKEEYLERMLNIFFKVNEYKTSKIKFVKDQLNLSEKLYQKLKIDLKNINKSDIYFE